MCHFARNLLSHYTAFLKCLLQKPSFHLRFEPKLHSLSGQMFPWISLLSLRLSHTLCLDYRKSPKLQITTNSVFLSNSGQVFLDEIASLHLPGSVCPSVCLHLLESHLSAARIYSLHCILRRTNLFREILISF